MISNVNILESTVEELYSFISSYMLENDLYYDSYNEYFIFNSSIYKIIDKGQLIGCFAIFKNKTLSLFQLDKRYSKVAMKIFEMIKKYEGIDSAYVLTHDSQFLSLCLDKHSKIENYGFFCLASKEKVKLETNLKLVLATKDDLNDLQEIQKEDNYFEELDDFVESKSMYKVMLENNLVGFAMYEIGYFNNNLVSYSFYVNSAYRGSGYAKQIYTMFTNKGIDEGKIGISGCAYDNMSSLNAQLSSEATCESRLYKIIF